VEAAVCLLQRPQAPETLALVLPPGTEEEATGQAAVGWPAHAEPNQVVFMRDASTSRPAPGDFLLTPSGLYSLNEITVEKWMH
jgi:hypothetical protein